jgi:hypothetical protein
MRRVLRSTGTHASVRRCRRIAPLLAVVVLSVVAPDVAAASASGSAGAGHGATLDHAHALATLDAAVATADRHDRRDVPSPWAPALAGIGALAVAVSVVLRARRRPHRTPRPAFRRRAPPLLRTIA